MRIEHTKSSNSSLARIRQMSSSKSSSSSKLSNNEEKQKLFEANPLKKLKNSIVQMMQAIYTFSVDFFPLHNFISVWRIVQFIGPALVASYLNFWGENTLYYNAISIISILFHIVPPDYRDAAGMYIEFIYFAIITLSFIIIVAFAIFFRIKARLINAAPYLFAVFYTAISYLLHPIVFQMIGESIGRLIYRNNIYNFGTEIAAIILALLSYIGYQYFMIRFNSVTISFRPHSLMCVLYLPEILFTNVSSIVTLVIAIASQLSLIPRLILTGVGAIIYFASTHIVFMPGTFISLTQRKFIFSASMTCGLFLLLVIVYDILGRNATFIEFFVFILVFVIIFSIIFIISKKLDAKKLLFLENKGDNIYNFTSFGQYVNIVTLAFENSHPILNDWKLLKDGSSKFEENINYWFIFAKYVAIYPEESKLLNYIAHSILAHDFHGFVSSQIISQIQTILTQREDSLSQELKSRLQKLSRQVHHSKRKIRHIWDLAIQSNTTEMEPAIRNAYNSVNKTRSHFEHLLGLYPNNRFVARAYACYIIDVEADQQAYTEWCDKIRKLQRGILVNPDRVNLLGMHAYPILPALAQNAPVMQKSAGQSESELPFFESYADFDEDAVAQVNEQITVLQEKIKTLRIPAVDCIIIWTSILFFILILIPAIAMLVYGPIFLDSFTSSLDYMYHLSLIRCCVYILPTFTQHYVCENCYINFSNLSQQYSNVEYQQLQETSNPEDIADIVRFFPKPAYTKFNLSNFDNATETSDQIKYLITLNSESIQQITRFRNWMVDNENLSIVNELVFGEIIPYTYYQENGTYQMNLSLISALMEISLMTTQVLNMTISFDLLSSPYIVNPIYNGKLINDYISRSLQLIYNYIYEKNRDIDNLLIFCMIFACVIYVLVILGFLVYQITSLDKTKNEIYQCLTVIPKNVLSQVAESLDIIEDNQDVNTENECNDYDDQLYNKQDENILKVLSSASEVSVTRSDERSYYIFLNVVLLCCVIGICVLVCEVLPTITTQLSINAPHLDYVLGSVSNMFAAIGYLNFLAASLYGFENPLITWQEFANYSEETNGLFVEYYNIAEYGSPNQDIPYFQGFAEAYQEGSLWFTCEDQIALPTRFIDTFACFALDSRIYLMSTFISTLIWPPQYNITKYPLIDTQEMLFNNLFAFGARMYDKLFFPMFDTIVSDITVYLGDQIPRLRDPAIVLLVICFLLVLCIYYIAHISSDKIKFTLSLLLQVPPSVVMQTSKIMNILAGYFGSNNYEVTTRHRDFFDGIVGRIPNSVITTNSSFIIDSINKSTERIYGISFVDFKGKNMREFLVSEAFSDNAENLFENTSTEELVEYRKTEDDLLYLHINLMKFKSNFVFTTRDVTQEQSYKKLIHDEKEKSDKLLNSILPSNLIQRVQNGEKNISFSVQSATILFLDIVEFTPWCAANTAQVIMSTLNIMFREFDSRLMRHSTMTKIKCIGDCYMCAGGIFVEVNQPAVHAKEVVEFGLEVIQALLDINKEYSLSLRIRVGINTGGPLVAGVFGTEKPTFEILGPAINMAQQMEHHGVPMLVHISRSTYELIYGGVFKIKERGNIEIKNGSVATYLVSGKNV